MLAMKESLCIDDKYIQLECKKPIPGSDDYDTAWIGCADYCTRASPEEDCDSIEQFMCDNDVCYVEKYGEGGCEVVEETVTKRVRRQLTEVQVTKCQKSTT